MTKIIVARFIQKYEFNLEKNYILGFEFTNTYTATSPMKFNLDEKLIDWKLNGKGNINEFYCYFIELNIISFVLNF